MDFKSREMRPQIHEQAVPIAVKNDQRPSISSMHRCSNGLSLLCHDGSTARHLFTAQPLFSRPASVQRTGALGPSISPEK